MFAAQVSLSSNSGTFELTAGKVGAKGPHRADKPIDVAQADGVLRFLEFDDLYPTVALLSAN